MKSPLASRFSRRARALAAVATLTLSVGSVSAQTTLTYDADTTAPANDGTGVWNTTTANWYNGTTDVVWSNGLTDTAVFGAAAAGTGGTVTVGTVNVGTISFAPQTTTGYTLSGGTITLGTGITTTSAVNNTISSVIAGSNGAVLTGVAGSSVGVTLSGANTYTGITSTATGGRFTVSNATALGSNAGATVSALGSNYTQVNAGTTLAVAASTAEAFLLNGTGSATSGALRLANGVALSSFVQLGSDALITGGFGSNTISGNVDLAAHLLTVGNGGNTINLTISGLVTNTGGSTTGFSIGQSPNSLILTNNGNTYTGTTTVGTGTLGLGGDTVLGSSTLALGGTVQSTSATARTIANTLALGNTIFGATTVNTGALTFTNTTLTSLGAATSKTFTTNVNTTFNTPFSSGGTAATLTKQGAATLFLAATNSTFTTQTSINAGTLNVASLANAGVNSSLGAAAATTGLLQFGGGTLQYTGATAQSTNKLFTINTGGATLDASGSVPAATVSFTGTGTLDAGSGATARSLTLTGTNTGVNSLAAIIPDSATTPLSVIKSGAGTWSVSGSSTFSGGTSINGGTLLVNNLSTGSGTGSGFVTVGNGTTLNGTLGGNGTIGLGATTGNVVTVNSGSTLAPGNSPGLLTVTSAVAGGTTLGTASLNLAGGSIFSAEINGTTAGTLYDQVLLSGTNPSVFLAGNLTLTLGGGFTPAPGDTFTLINNTTSGALTGAFANAPFGSTFTSGSTTFNVTNGDGNDVVLMAMVPEPSTYALLGLGLGGLGLTVARRRRQALSI